VDAGISPVAGRRVTGRQSALDMVRSLAVILAIVAVIVFLIPRPNGVTPSAVDVTGAAAAARSELGFSPAVPQGLPVGWKATSVGLRDGTDGALTWHVGYLTPQGRYASIEQAAGASHQWEVVLDSGGTDRDPQTIDGLKWDQRYKDVRDVTALIHRGGGRTTMVTSKGGGLTDATLLARSLPASTL